MLRSTAKVAAYERWLDSSPSSDFTPLPARLLLDLPPQEVRVRIACFLSHGAQTPHLLALARTNAVQRSAVLSALHRRLVLPSASDTPILARWIDVFLYDVRELVCNRGCLRNIARGIEPHPVSLCQMSTLRKVTLFDETDVLDAVSNSASIKDVVLKMRGQAEAELILRTLRSFNLKSLELVCVKESIKCRFQALLELTEEKDSIPACCPNLRVLHLRCQYHCMTRNSNFAADFLWRSLPGLRKLQEVTLCAEPPDELLPLLDELRAVRIDNVPDVTPASSLVRRFAPRLTAFRSNECFVPKHSAALAMCTRLEELATTLERGNEAALGQAIRAMEGLRTLALEWKRFEEDPWEDVMREEQSSSPFSEAKDVVPLIVDNAQRVEELTLRRVSIPVGDVVSILRGVGGQLRIFEVDVVAQEEEPLERLKTLLEAVAMHCPGLRQLTVAIEAGLLCKRLGSYEKDGDWVQLELQKRNVERVLQVVRRRVPMLDVRDVEALLSRFDQVLSPSRGEPRGRSPGLAQDVIDSDNDSNDSV